jgi:hypothetical protein
MVAGGQGRSPDNSSQPDGGVFFEAPVMRTVARMELPSAEGCDYLGFLGLCWPFIGESVPKVVNPIYRVVNSSN